MCLKLLSPARSVFIIKYVYTSWASKFNEATFREILLPSSGNVNDIDYIWSKYADKYAETKELADLGEKKLRNATN